MKRSDVLMAILASAEGRSLSPVQLQKAAFLLDRNVPGIVDDGPAFSFVPYDYGPFDKAVYEDANALARGGFAVISPSGNGNWNIYAASDVGITTGKRVLERMEPRFSTYTQDVVNWVRAQSFGSLVKSIYNSYPEMKENSVFQG